MNILSVLSNIAAESRATMQHTGMFKVGTLRASLKITGTKRRQLKVQFWYPTDSEDTAVSRWRDRCARILWPTQAPALYNARPLSTDGPLRLITYLPDAPGYRIENTYTLSGLASHGFVLAAICEPYSLTSEFVQQRLARTKEAALWTDSRVRSGVLAASALLDAIGDPQACDTIAAWAEKFDLKRVGILGCGMGGTAAVTAITIDSRYAAGATLDGLADERPLVKVPYLHMSGRLDDDETAEEGACEGIRSTTQTEEPKKHNRTQASLPTSHIMDIAGARTALFTDRFVALMRWASASDKEAIVRVRSIVDSYTVAFFKTYLEMAPHPLMCVRHSPFPEVRFVEAQAAVVAHPIKDNGSASPGRMQTGLH